MTCPNRAEINRQNARHSTGPKSDAGKARSALNALKHGLTAQSTVVIPGEDKATYLQALQRWFDDLQPANAAEQALVESACRASWKLGRCARHEDAVLAQNARSAADRHAQQRRARASELGRRLIEDTFDRCAFTERHDPVMRAKYDQWYQTDPAAVVSELELTAEGIDWMLDKWTELARILEKEGFWHYPQKYALIRLMGRRPEDALDDPPVRRIFQACQVLHPEAWNDWDDYHQATLGNEARATYYWRVEFHAEDRPATREAALEALWKVVRTEMERLARMKVLQLDARAELDRTEAVERALFDDGPSAALRLRYEMAATRTLHQSLAAYTKLREAGDKVAPIGTEEDVMAVEEPAPVVEAVPGSNTEAKVEKEVAAQDAARRGVAAASRRNEAIYERGEVKRAGAENLGREPPHIPLAVGVGRSGPSQTTPAVPVRALPAHIP